MAMLEEMQTVIVHCGMGFDTTNAEDERIFEFGHAVGMAMCKTFFEKEDSKLIIYQSRDNRSMIDYLIVRKTDRCLVNSVSHSIQWLLVDLLYKRYKRERLSCLSQSPECGC